MADFTELDELAYSSEQPRRKPTAAFIILLFFGAIPAVVGLMGLLTKDAGDTTEPTPTTVEAPVETVVYPQVIDGTEPVVDTIDPTTQLQPTRRDIDINSESIAMKIWTDQYGVDDLANVHRAVGMVGSDGADPGALRVACENVAIEVTNARTHPPIPNTALNEIWQNALDGYEKATVNCQKAIDSNDTALLEESLAVLSNPETLGPVFWGIEANRSFPVGD